MLLIAVTFIIFLMLGMPIAFTMGFPAIIYMIIYRPEWLTIVPSRIFSGIDVFVFLAIPFFIMAGEVMLEFKITDRLIRFVDALVGHVRGGLAQVNVFDSMFFGGISGAALADIAALGSIVIPAMEKNGYPRKYAAALTAATSIQGPIIPPSIIMVVYASIMGASVGAMFAAGLVPGILLGLSDCLIVAIQSKRRGFPKRETPFSLKELITSFIKAVPALVIPAIIVSGILGGVFTPTEAGAVTVFYGFFLGFFFLGGFHWQSLIRILKSTMIKTATLFIIVAFASLFSWVLAMENIPQAVGQFLLSWTNNKYTVLLIMNLVFLFMGTWLETTASLILMGPIFAQILNSLGVHPLHYGIVMVLNLVIGLITPPFGICLFAVSALSGCTVEEVSRECFPFIMVNIGVLFLITYFPDLVLIVPRLLGLA